jgi:hypothetical protein
MGKPGDPWEPRDRGDRGKRSEGQVKGKKKRIESEYVSDHGIGTRIDHDHQLLM